MRNKNIQMELNFSLLKRFFYLHVFLLFFVISYSNSYATWYDPNFQFKLPIDLSVSSGTTQANHSVEIVINSSMVGPSFIWSNECSDNSFRGRFVNSSQDGELPHFVSNCSISNQSMTVWVKVEEVISTSPITIYMYYGNTGGTYSSNPENTFTYYANFSEFTFGSGSSQDADGFYNVLDNGRAVNVYGNTWKSLSGQTWNIDNSGNEILEIDMIAQDCGEIVGFGLLTTEGISSPRTYKWCGSQGWGVAPEVTYSGLGTWQRVQAILNDFTEVATRLHLAADDDADGSTNYTYRDVKIRKYHSVEPSYNFGTEEVANVSLIYKSPVDNFRTRMTTFPISCGGITINTSSLENVSLYGNFSGTYELYDTENLSGLSDNATFSVTVPNVDASYLWNCEVYDNAGNSDFGDTNYTIEVDITPPSVTIISPQGLVNDVTPRLNVSFNENVSSAWYSINSSNNISLCTECNFSSENFFHLSEGSYSIEVFAQDDVGNVNSSTESFIVDMNSTYFDDFSDNSSIDIFSESKWNGSAITFSGGFEYYEGIAVGIGPNDLTFVANQLNGAPNAGDVGTDCSGSCWFIDPFGNNRSVFAGDMDIVALDGDFTTQGFIVYSNTDVETRFAGINPESGPYFFAACFSSGQWFYDDNDGCTIPFTPNADDVIVANLTWGITNVSEISISGTGSSLLTSKEINTTLPIYSIENITWNELNTDANNTIAVELSLDSGITWYNVSNGSNLTNITPGNSLVYRVNMTSENQREIGIDSIHITWSHIQVGEPTIVLLSPEDNATLIRGNELEFLFNVSDDDTNLTCNLFIDGNLTQSRSCSSNSSVSFNVSDLGIGTYNWNVQVVDNDSFIVNSSTRYFNVERSIFIDVDKSLSYLSSNMYLVELKIENKFDTPYNGTLLDFIDEDMSYGSFSRINDFSDTITGLKYSGDIIGWDISLSGNETQYINYSLSGVDNYMIIDTFMLGFE